jgi:hypothetical protein
MVLSDELESAGTSWQTYDIGQGERRLDLLLGDETMLPPDDVSPSNIIEILVANHQAKHTHSNKSALDEITTAKIAEWDTIGTHTHDGYATADHVHDGYASQADLDLLEDVVDTKAASTHSHSEYASTSHVHSDYATQISLDTLAEEVNGKADASHTHTDYASVSHLHNEYAEVSHSHDNYALSTHTHTGFADEAHTHTEYAEVNHSHSNYALTTHNHDSDYAFSTHTHTASEVGAAASGHNHDEDYAEINHNHDTVYANIGHDHDEDYAQLLHSHADYATVASLSEVSATVSGKANASHTHNDIYYTETEIDTKLAGKADSSHNHTGVYDASGAAASALTSANAYTDSKIDALVGEGASTTLDTIGEISSAIEDNQDAIDLLNSAIANKANASDLTSHTGNTTIHVTATDKNNWNVAKTHADSAHAPSNAQANQNAFSNIKVGDVTVAADTTTDTLTLVAGSNVTLTPSAANDSITISATNTVYTHPTSAGNKHIPAGGSSGQILRWSADGTAVWGADNNTTYSVATQTSNGLMSNTDKTKLDGVAEGANNYTLPSAGTTLGGVKTTSTVTSTSGLTACPIINGVPYYKDTNNTYSLSSFGITSTAAELNYTDGVTSNIQTQLNAKLAKSAFSYDSATGTLTLTL